MPTKCFKTPAAVQDIFDSEPLLGGWTHELHQAGYAEITAHRHIRAAKHFMDWINQQGIEAAGLNESSVMKFGDHLRRCPRWPPQNRPCVATSKPAI